MKLYCTQNNENCSTCSLVNYNKDCNNNPITQKETRLNIRISPELKEKFEIWCAENGTDPSHETRRYLTLLTKDIKLNNTIINQQGE
jgi:hypothetical protein